MAQCEDLQLKRGTASKRGSEESEEGRYNRSEGELRDRRQLPFYQLHRSLREPHTVGADKGYDTRDFVAECRYLNATPHVAQNTTRRGGSAIDQRTTRHYGYAVSQRKRKRIEECFGWLKTIALMRKVRHRGIEKVGWLFTLAAAAYNLVRMRKLTTSPVGAS